MSTLHFEIQAEDPNRARAFYSGLFGWTIEKVPAEWDYWMIHGKGIGGINPVSGGLLPRNTDTPAAGSGPRGAVAVFHVAEVDDRYDWALAHGGAEALPPFDMPGIGRAAYVEDGEGNIVGLLKAAEGI